MKIIFNMNAKTFSTRFLFFFQVFAFIAFFLFSHTFFWYSVLVYIAQQIIEKAKSKGILKIVFLKLKVAIF